MKFSTSHILLIFSTLSLNACFSGDSDVQAFTEEVKSSSVGKIKELPKAKEYHGEDFTAQDLLSPFDLGARSEGRTDGSAGDGSDSAAQQLLRPDAQRKREFLEGFPLESLSMVGTMTKNKSTWGLLRDRSGLVHVVKVGDYIGQDSGQIVAIDDEKISVVETVSAGAGHWVQRSVSIGLAPEQKRGK